MQMNETVYSEALTEDQIDETAGVIKGVRILGKESRNGRTYSREAMQGARPLYEGAEVNIDHAKPDKSGSITREFDAGFGELRKVEFRETGADYWLEGDLHYLKTHPRREQVIERARRFPTKIGLSHTVEGDIKTVAGKRVVEKIERVHSVDVVSRPATNKTFFESEGENMAEKTTIRKLLEKCFPHKSKAALITELEDAAGMAPSAEVEAPASGDSEASIKAAFRAMVVAAFDDEKLDTAATMKRIKDILTSQEKLMGKAPDAAPAASGGDTPPATESEALKLVRQLQEKLDAKDAEADCRAILEDLSIPATPIRVKTLVALPAELREETAKTWTGARETGERRERPAASAPLHEQLGDGAETGTYKKRDGKAFAESMTE